MRILPRRRHEHFAGLSCYTANLAGYLDGELSDATGHLARSVRLAVRIDLAAGLAFSHHAYPLDRLPDGTRLRYATLAPRPAMVSLAGELRRRGRVLVVTDGSRLPWSPSRQHGAAAPHWLLVTGRRGDSWHVIDAFAGLLPGGEQRPYVGWLSTAQLTDAMVLPAGWSTEQHTRNSLAFGFPVPVPDPAGPLWLHREPGPATPAELPGSWLVGDRAVLPFLADYCTDSATDAARHLDDLWTAAAHRVFRYRWLCTDPDLPDPLRQRYLAASTAWTQLPSALRFALDSARRGRARPSLVRQTFGHLLEVDPVEDHILTAPRREA
ncbi:MAG TPA: hypothetical protein VFV67_11810 [Actinophytocola sp.]|uniref:hypothetical protein n=1 Tax=Actinophytocola sp. TaxID=1872138 RepID=UPI002DC05DC1|nr:hypothetical protein [Actinophytocola sp.]HEU5471332.1 hypothetical protein [Actinophytocola sp.]